MRVVIVGAGPAGMMLAHILARNGVGVQVLERHPDFHREFRGEVLQPSALRHLDELGLRDTLVERGILRPAPEIAMFVAGKKKLGIAADGYGAGGSISQPRFLEVLDEKSRAFAGYALDWNCAVVDVAQENGRVTGVKTKDGAVIAADLVVISSGRNTPLRKATGGAAQLLEPPYPLLWLRFDRPSPVKGLAVYREKTALLFAYSTADDKTQVAWKADGEDMAELRMHHERLRARFDRDAPAALRALMDGTKVEEQELQVLKVICDRVDRWHAPGVLLIGDAAHTMSPVGAQGVNIAIRDAVVAANEIIDVTKRAGANGDVRAQLDDAAARVQQQREPEVKAIQRMQSLLSKVLLQGSVTRANVALTVARPFLSLVGGETPFASGTVDVRVRFA